MIEQIAIAICGVSAVMLSQDKRSNLRKYACLFGLAGEPFWLWAAWKADQWGIVILVFFYTWGWGKGFYNFWIRREPA